MLDRLGILQVIISVELIVSIASCDGIQNDRTNTTDRSSSQSQQTVADVQDNMSDGQLDAYNKKLMTLLPADVMVRLEENRQARSQLALDGIGSTVASMLAMDLYFLGMNQALSSYVNTVTTAASAVAGPVAVSNAATILSNSMSSSPQSAAIAGILAQVNQEFASSGTQQPSGASGSSVTEASSTAQKSPTPAKIPQTSSSGPVGVTEYRKYCTSEKVQTELAAWDGIIKSAVAKTDAQLSKTNQYLGQGFLGNITGWGQPCNLVADSMVANIDFILRNGKISFTCTSVGTAVNDAGPLSHAFIVVFDVFNFHNVLRQYDPWRTGSAVPLPYDYQDVDGVVGMMNPNIPMPPTKAGPFVPGPPSEPYDGDHVPPYSY